ncbi:PREDICTED: decaprenyl-diphosphate synthase subunit 2-like [Amphimedon queenslandica]|uniref:Uncharacterized protein n=1 Tax=Amphimedon queenslandica TaxID=400682 RepID=A0A1X7VI13_AMPQE|nr:PREDICTED: decaprenyl-diphosphate synthase subunit 2-like [Amphimedon queenslandica]|eukprot:XP_003384094.1 PREDICTED: decaprenyl-diphosphate synthase subunit 2-like [Amphimedon queenslandica]
MFAITCKARFRLGRSIWSLLPPSLFLSSFPTSPDHPILSPNTSSSSFTSSLERLIGYPTPLLSLRHLLGNELSHLSGHARRLLASQHPIVERSKSFINAGSHSPSHTQGMLTLLVAKALNLVNPVLPDLDQFGILPSQRVLAEVTEMIAIAHMIHREVVDLELMEEGEGTREETLKGGYEEGSSSDSGDLSFGNKLVILGGDILLARACKELSLLYKPQVVGLMSQGISSLMEDTFKAQDSVSSHRQQLQSSSRMRRPDRQPLLASSCQSCAIVAELDPLRRKQASDLGLYISILLQAPDRTESSHDKIDARDDNECHYVSNLALSILEELPESEPRNVLSNFVASRCNET